MDDLTAARSNLTYAGEVGFPRNQWYVAAFSDEVRNTPTARVLLNTPVVLYRTEEGMPVALYDRCPHRGLPLSMGKIIADRIQCGYHGMQFAPSGACVNIPSQDNLPRSMGVQAYPLVEKWRWLWIWLGDPEKADQSLIPDHRWLGLEVDGYHPVQAFKLDLCANYQFMHDNLLDTSHLSYLHPGLLDTGDMAQSRFWTDESGQLIRLGREMPGSIFPPDMATYFRVRSDIAYDRTLTVETFVPSISIGKQSIRDPGDPTAPPTELFAINALTPADDRSTHLFHVQVTSFDARWTSEDIAGMRYIVEQDRVALESLQSRFDKFHDRTEISVRSDQAGIICRRIIENMIHDEVRM